MTRPKDRALLNSYLESVGLDLLPAMPEPANDPAPARLTDEFKGAPV